jgi:hypothetical protein
MTWVQVTPWISSHGYSFQIAVPAQHCTLFHSVMGMPVPGFQSCDFVDMLIVLIYRLHLFLQQRMWPIQCPSLASKPSLAPGSSTNDHYHPSLTSNVRRGLVLSTTSTATPPVLGDYRQRPLPHSKCERGGILIMYCILFSVIILLRYLLSHPPCERGAVFSVIIY